MDRKEKKVEYGGHQVIINEELIDEATGLEMEGYHFFNKRIDKNSKENKFSDDGEELKFVTAGFRVSSIPKPFDEVTKKWLGTFL